jgi:hypothetical protein
MVVLKKTRSGGIFLLLLFLVLQKSDAFLSPLSTAGKLHRMTTTQTQALAQFAPEAVALFNNMKTPAAIIGGALVPLGLLAPLPFYSPPGVEESRFKKSLRMLYTLVAVLSLASELLTVVWATVTTNKLIETTVAPAASVWYVGKYVKGWQFLVLKWWTQLNFSFRALLKRDYDLEWSATNAHFVAGMCGFLFLIGTRVFFHASGGLMGRSLAGFSCSALMLMVAIVNRGVAAGSGDGLSYGTNCLHLWTNYVMLLLKRATRPESFGILEVGAAAVMVWSIQGFVRGAWQNLQVKDNNKSTRRK